MTFTLVAGSVVTPDEEQRPGWLTLEGGTITAVGAGRPPASRLIDLGDRVLAPGFVDLHVHGAARHQVNGDDRREVAHAVRRVATHHTTHGTTAMLATTVSDSPEALLATVTGIGEAMRDSSNATARILGAHLEGPWLAASRAGAHDERQLRAPDEAELAGWLTTARGVVRMVTLAPELAGGLAMIQSLREHGIVVSVGHTEADAATTRAAFDAGARHVTHLFNAMPGLHHRAPGPVGAALADERVTVELVADGHHIDPTLYAMVMRAASGRVVAVTDAVSTTGPAVGSAVVGTVAVDVLGDRVVVRGAPETIAGSVLTMDRAVANLVAAGVSLLDAVNAASAVPAAVVGEEGLGRLRAGARADVVVLGADLACHATIVGGVAAFDPSGLIVQLADRM